MPIDMKTVIAETFKKMLLQGNVDKITVKALISECHISRQTFYYHFQDMMDVMEWSIQQETKALVEQSMQTQDMRSALQIFISFVVERFSVIRKLMDSQRRIQFDRFIVECLETYLSALAWHQSRDIPVNQADREMLLQYNAYGLFGILLAYGGRPDLDQERLAGQLERILTGELSAWDENGKGDASV